VLRLSVLEVGSINFFIAENQMFAFPISFLFFPLSFPMIQNFGGFYICNFNRVSSLNSAAVKRTFLVWVGRI
jgi:hypothetical protein